MGGFREQQTFVAETHKRQDVDVKGLFQA
jgi:hypothetical protein